MRASMLRKALLGLTLAALPACAAWPQTAGVPAVITRSTAASHSDLERAVSQALGGIPVRLADDALTRSSLLLIGRAQARDARGLPLNGRELERPQHFRLLRRGSQCRLLHIETGRSQALPHTRCRVLSFPVQRRVLDSSVGGVMKTMSGNTRVPRLGLYVGLALTLSASLALEGAVLWLALDPASRLGAAVLAALACVGLLCLIGGALTAASVRRQEAVGERAHEPRGVPRPRTGEEAAALAHAQKMEALGVLAGGVAHDFNNLLHVIRNSLEILQRQSPPAEAARHLEMIRRSSDRATALTRHLLAFSRRQPPQPLPLDPNDVVRQVAELLRHFLGERIAIETILAQEVWSVAADAGQLETALLNLAINARDAMPQAGLLTIETANATLDESSAATREARSADPYVMIAVSDTGTGMPPEVAARACEPFFTTKEPGQGTGLGLSQVAGFAHQVGGHVRISSEPGKGTTVRLFLPQSASGRLEVKLEPPLPAACEAWPIKEATHGAPVAMGAGPER
jgi:signal transduction histidine kinase